MKKSVKFAISIPQEEFEALEDSRVRSGQTRSAFILRAVRAWLQLVGASGEVESAVKEDPTTYGTAPPVPRIPEPHSLFDPAEVRRRAMAAAGRFESQEGDLSLKHDEVLAEGFADVSRDDGTVSSQKSGGED
jgi:hypothetical protein